MNNKFYLALLSTLLLSQGFTERCTTEKGLKIEYIGYSRNVYDPNFSSLQFELTNTSEDTLYISVQNIIIKVKKDKTWLNEENPQDSIGTPFVKPRMSRQHADDSKIAGQKQIQKIKARFAAQLYDSNFGKKSKYKDDKLFIIDNIIRDCIVLLPRQSISYTKGFRNTLFDKNCTVIADYFESNIFTYFVNKEGIKVDVMY